MRKRSRFITLGGVLFVLALLAACAPPKTAHPPTAVLPTEVVISTIPVPDSTAPGESETQATPAVSEGGIPADVPIMEGAYKLQIALGGESVIYQVDQEIQAVVAFYQEAMASQGWEVAGPPDSVVGSIAQMLRRNSTGDQLTVNMQENKVGGFVNITVRVVRAQ